MLSLLLLLSLSLLLLVLLLLLLKLSQGQYLASGVFAIYVPVHDLLKLPHVDCKHSPIVLCALCQHIPDSVASCPLKALKTVFEVPKPPNAARLHPKPQNSLKAPKNPKPYTPKPLTLINPGREPPKESFSELRLRARERSRSRLAAPRGPAGNSFAFGLGF